MERRKGMGRVMTGKRSTPLAIGGPIAPRVITAQLRSTPVSAASSAPSHLILEAASVQEYRVRVPKVTKKQHNLMRFNGALNVDFSKWNNVRMQREDNSYLYKTPDFGQLDLPKFGAGSEYGREQREEARRRKYGISKKKYKRENQPWLLKTGNGETSRKFKGLREGGVNENASYFIFTQAQEGYFEVFPIREWYNFTPIQRYKALSAEEAEEQFSKRSKIMNLFSVMVQKRMRDDKDELEEDKSEKKGSKPKKSDMQVTEMDEWVQEMDDEEDSEEEAENAKTAKSKKKIKKKGKGSDDELDIEDSDDGDGEGREQDYMSDISSESEDEEEKKPDLPGIDQDENLRALLESASSSEEDSESKKDENEEEDGTAETKKKKSKKKKKIEKKANVLPDAPALGTEEVDMDVDEADNKVEVIPEVKPEPVQVVKEEPISNKRKAVEVLTSSPKKPKVDIPLSTLQMATAEGITEEAVRKYLLRKPMTIAELLQKFKPKKSKVSGNDMVPIIAHIFKKLNPEKRILSNKTYFFINNKS